MSDSKACACAPQEEVENEDIILFTAEDIAGIGYGYVTGRENVAPEDIAPWQLQLAQDIINQTSSLDNVLNIEVIRSDESDDLFMVQIPQHVLYYYKAFAYTLMCEAHRANEKTDFYKTLAYICCSGMILLAAAFNLPVWFFTGIEAFVDHLKK